MKRLLLFFFLAFTSVNADPIQPAPLPNGPLLKRTGKNSAWLITFHYEQDKRTNGNAADYGPGPEPEILPSPPRRITVTRTHPRWLAVTECVKGEKLEQCFDGRHEYLSTPKNSRVDIVVDDPNAPKTLTDYSAVDFPDLEWVSAETFKGIQNVADTSCMVFVYGPMTAWIDLHSRWPVLWKRNGELRSFRKLPPPEAMVPLPPQIQQVSEVMERGFQKLRHPARKRG